MCFHKVGASYHQSKPLTLPSLWISTHNNLIVIQAWFKILADTCSDRPISTGIGCYCGDILQISVPRLWNTKFHRKIFSNYWYGPMYHRIFCPLFFWFVEPYFSLLFLNTTTTRWGAVWAPPTTLSTKNQPNHKILTYFFMAKPSNSQLTWWLSTSFSRFNING